MENRVDNNMSFDRNASNARSAVAKVREGMGELAGEAREASSHGIDVAKQSITDSTHAAKEAANEKLEAVSTYIREQPLKGVAFAVGTGFLIGLLLKRKM